MKASDNLFQLIKSLTPSEKRYFKIFSTKHVIGDENNYIRLFEAIELQQVYNEREIKDQFKKERFINRLPFEKNYLYAQVIKSLIAFGSNSVNRQLRDNQETIALLYDKGLLEQCEKLIHKTKRIANAYEKFSVLLELLDWEKRVTQKLGINMELVLSSISSERESILDQLQNLSQYQFMTDRLLSFFQQKGFAGKGKTFAEAKNFMKGSLMKSEDRATSLQAKVLFHLISTMYYIAFAKNDLKNYVHCKRSVELMETNPHFIEDDIEKYVFALTRLFSVTTAFKKYDEAKEIIARLKAARHKYADYIPSSVAGTFFVYTYKLQMALQIETGDFDHVEGTGQEVYEGLKRYGDKIGKEKAILLFFLARVYFGAQHFRLSLKIINDLINLYANQLGAEMSIALRMMNMLVHYELKNTELLPREIRSTYRFLHELNTIYKFEKTMLGFIKEMPLALTPKEIIESFHKLKTKLVKISKDPQEAFMINTSFDYISWLESKIDRRSFASVIKEKALN